MRGWVSCQSSARAIGSGDHEFVSGFHMETISPSIVRVILWGNDRRMSETYERATETETASLASLTEFVVGGRNDSAATFEGRVDEVAVYDRVLSPDEVVAHYAAAGTFGH